MVFVSCQFIWHCLLLIRVACQSFNQLACSWISLKILEFSGLHYCLFVKDHNLLLRKSCVALLLFSAATLISYHNRFRLSTTFLKSFSSWKTLFSVTGIYTNISVRLCQQLFWNLFKFLSSCCVVSVLPQQRIWVYHPLVYLSTLFFEFFTQIIPCYVNSA